MRLCTRMIARKLMIAGTVFVGILDVSSGAVAQTQQPKAPARVEAPAEAAGQPSRPQPNWIVNCSQTRQGLECRAVQSLFLRQTRQRVLSVAVRVPADTKKPVLLLQLPLGVYLPAGASLQIGKEEAKTLPFLGCDRAGCIAEYDVTDGELNTVAKGADITISAQTMQKKPFSLAVPALGFAAAYAKIK
jgi:invasion protein IalB